MMQVDKNIPLPNAKTSGNKYPWRQMEVGDSFLVQNREHANVCSVAANAGKRYGMKFATRKEADGVRVWRIE